MESIGFVVALLFPPIVVVTALVWFVVTYVRKQRKRREQEAQQLTSKSEMNPVAVGNITTRRDWRTLKLRNETRESQKAVFGLAGLTGFVSGLIGFALIGFGSLCCLTVIGAVIGVPMIVLGVIFLASSPFALFFGMVGRDVVKADSKLKEAKLKEEMLVEAGGVVSIKDPCPWCGTKVSSYSNVNAIDCPACSERIVIYNRMYLRG